MSGDDAEASTATVQPMACGPWVMLLAAWCAGTLLGRQFGGVWGWVGVGVLLVTGAWCVRARHRLRVILCALAVTCLAAGWWSLRVGPMGVWGLGGGERNRLLRVEGTVEGDIWVRRQSKGVMGSYDYRPPATQVLLAVDRAEGRDGWHRVRAKLIVDIPAFDGRMATGDRVRCTGWLAELHKPYNPGERDRAAGLQNQGVVGRLSLKSPANCEPIEVKDPNTLASNAWRASLGHSTQWALHHGLPEYRLHDPSVSLLDMLLLGERDAVADDVYVAFREAGLAHALAVSGLHMGILVMAAWWAMLVVGIRPSTAAVGALAAVGLYVAMVPNGVAVWRAGLMSAAACVAWTFGRRISALAAMCAAAIVLLVLQPWQMFAAGFQLSFLVVAGLLLFVPRLVASWNDNPIDDAPRGTQAWLRRRLSEYAAVAVVGWLVSLPLVAYHFAAVVPVGLVSGMLMLPIVALALWLGYLKVIVTMAWPWAGAWLGQLLWPLGDAMIWLARGLADLPGATVHVAPPSPWWAITTTAVVWALLGGWFIARRYAALACLLLCTGWLFWPAIAEAAACRWGPTPLRLNMFAVGDGSCYLLRSGGQAWVYDCGSSNYPDITTASIAPTLRSLGVARVDTLILSHPDADHFSGSLELVEYFGVRRVVTTQAFLDEAGRQPGSAAAFLVEQLKKRNVKIETAARGWRQELGGVKVTALWPPEGRKFERGNDGSLVLTVEASGRRILMTGDIQQQAMTMMLEDGDTRPQLDSDVMELSHHGSMVDAAPRFLQAVSPSHVLQSTGAARLRNDLWREHLSDLKRHVTHWHGMVQIDILRDGTIHSHRFREGPIPIDDPSSPGILSDD